MKKYRKLEILGIPFTVELVTGTYISDDVKGMCDPESKYITLRDDLNTDQIFSTLIHEVIEGINGVLHLNIKHQTIVALELGLSTSYFGILNTISDISEDRKKELVDKPKKVKKKNKKMGF